MRIDISLPNGRIEEMISEKEVEYTAGLARLRLTREEKKKFQKELSLILDYIAQLNELKVENVEPTTSGGGASNVMREDCPVGPDVELGRQMLNQAVDEKDRFVKVKAILKRD